VRGLHQLPFAGLLLLLKAGKEARPHAMPFLMIAWTSLCLIA
jgi:hypothetical protein